MSVYTIVQVAGSVGTGVATFTNPTVEGNIIALFFTGFGHGPGFDPPAPFIPGTIMDDATPSSDTFELYTPNFPQFETSIGVYLALNIKGGATTVTCSDFSFVQAGGPSVIIVELAISVPYSAWGIGGNTDPQTTGGGIDLRPNGSPINIVFGGFGHSGGINRTGNIRLIIDSQSPRATNTTAAVAFITASSVLLMGGDYIANAFGTPSFSSSGTVLAVTHEVADGGDQWAAFCSEEFPFLAGLSCTGGVNVDCNNPPNGTVGVAYTHTFTGSGGTPPYTFSLVSGIFPPGLTLDGSTGILSGTPTTGGDFTFTIQLTDSATPAPNVAQVTCEITIDAPIFINCNNPPSGTIGVPYTHQILASGGVPPYTFSITGGSLPTGLSMDSTGLITGTPTTRGTYFFTVTVEDSIGQTVSVTCSISIGGKQPMRLTACDQDIYFDYTDTGGNAVCLRYEIPKRRWFLHNYGDAIVTHHYVEPSVEAPNDMQILMPSRTQALIYKAGGNTDNGVDIVTQAQTPSFDNGDQRSQKLYVDNMSDVEGTGTMEMTPFFDNSQTNVTPVTLTLTGPRIQVQNNIASLADLRLYRNISMKYTWTGGPDGPKLYAMEPSGFMQPYISTFYETQYLSLAFPGWKHMRRMYPAIICNNPIMLTIRTQDGRTYGPFTIASTSGQYRIVPQMLAQNMKDLAFAFQVDGQGNPFALFIDDFTVEVKEWQEETYIKLAVFKA